MIFLRTKSHYAVVRGLLIRQGRVLLVKHEHKDRSSFWCLPGGLVEEGETIKQALVREIKEETHLDAVPDELVFVQEFLKEKVLELIFLCRVFSGEAKIGTDPDNPGQPVLTDLAWKFFEELPVLNVKPNRLIQMLVDSGTDALSLAQFTEVLSKDT